MAIDTANRRQSCLDYEEMWAEAMPFPDGDIGTNDRRQIIWNYADTLPTFTGLIDVDIHNDRSDGLRVMNRAPR